MNITKLSVCVSMVSLLATLPAAYANEVVTNCTQVTAADAEDLDSTPNNMSGMTVAEDDESCVKVTIPFDYGDAPDPSYQTMSASDGARHQLGTDVYLGQCVDADNGTLQGLATADDEDNSTLNYGDCSNPDDEDGVTFGELTVGEDGATVEVIASKDCKLNAWVDWDIDGSWGGAAEHIFLNKQLSAGSNSLTFNIPQFAKDGDTYARFRCSTVGDDGIGGEAADGEVEDYKVTVLPATPKKPVSLGDYIWIDEDKDGQQDDGESPLKGAEVSLTDKDGNPVKDLDGILVLPKTTGTDGKYLFDNLPEGDYIVKVKAPDGYQPSPGGADPDDDASNTDSNCMVSNGVVQTPVVSLLEGTEPDFDADGDGTSGNMTVDCGFFLPKGDTHSIGNRVWVDDGNGDTTKANNGLMDDGEKPVVDGVVMELLDQNGTVMKYAETKDGYYLFTGLEAGEYSVCIAHGNFDQGILKGYTASTGGDETDVNADVDNNDNGENDVQDGLCSNVLVLNDQEPTGETPTASGIAGDDGAGTADERSNLTVDFGVIPPDEPPTGAVAVGNYIWIDSNGNGIQDKDERGLPGATVTLTDPAGAAIEDADGNPVAAQTTGEDGKYYFNNLPEGEYIVSVTPPDGYYLTTGGVDVDDDNRDWDSNCRLNPANNSIETHPFNLNVGAEPGSNIDGDDTNGNMTVDCGFYTSVAIGDKVWADKNANGKQDDGEPGIEGVPVSLFEEDGITPATDIDGNPVASITTGANGNYQFDELPPGNYVVVFKPDPKDGYKPTQGGVDPDNDQSNSDSNCKITGGELMIPAVQLGSGMEPGVAIDGDDANTNSTADCGLVRPVKLGNKIWIDLNGNGRMDGGEPGVPGTTVTLLKENGEPAVDIFGNGVAPQITDGTGRYTFNNLPEGSYFVKLVPPVGYVPTVSVKDPNNNDPNDSNGFINEQGHIVSKPITLTVGDEPDEGGSTNNSLAFGFIANLQVPTISQWGLMFMSMLLAAAGLFRRRKDS